MKIVFVANTVNAQNSGWLTEVKDNWNATGICIRILWNQVEPSKNSYDFTQLTNCINAIASKDMDIYIRICMGLGKPDYIGTEFSLNDFQIKKNGDKYDHRIDSPAIPENERYPLNFVSPTSRDRMTNLIAHVVQALNNLYPVGSGTRTKIKEIVPTFSACDEQEYPNAELCGYSSYEKESFINYLQTIYETIGTLNTKWNTTFTNFNTANINPSMYNWEELNTANYICPIGRIDWMNFRTKQLSLFIDALAVICHDKSFNMGTQIGSLYDGGIEKRGWVDPTTLFENKYITSLHTADVYTYVKNFDFSADYARSLCRFWATTKAKNMEFTTETNQPGYGGATPAILCSLWTEQLTRYYNRGASALYLIGWDIPTSTLQSYRISTDLYNAWNQKIIEYSNKDVLSINKNQVVHLGCEQVYYNHNATETLTEGGITYYKFEIYKSILPQSQYSSAITSNYNGDKDIITNNMIEINPTYINQYNNIYFTKASQYITDKAYLSFMKQAIIVNIDNGTWFMDADNHGKYEYTQGIKNEYNEVRSPIHLIWRERQDLQNIWPEANLPTSTSGYTIDFVTWAYNDGCGYSAQPTNREYPEWEVRDAGSTGLYKFDKNIRNYWDTHSYLQCIYTDGFNRIGSNTNYPANIISWTKCDSISSKLPGYRNWPYIGDISTSKTNAENNSAIPFTYTLEQNYPNPFNPSTTISFTLAEKGAVTLKIYDILGKEVASLVNDELGAGEHKVIFNAANYASGVYFYRISTGTFTQSKKMVLLK